MANKKEIQACDGSLRVLSKAMDKVALVTAKSIRLREILNHTTPLLKTSSN